MRPVSISHYVPCTLDADESPRCDAWTVQTFHGASPSCALFPIDFRPLVAPSDMPITDRHWRGVRRHRSINHHEPSVACLASRSPGRTLSLGNRSSLSINWSSNTPSPSRPPATHSHAVGQVPSIKRTTPLALVLVGETSHDCWRCVARLLLSRAINIVQPWRAKRTTDTRLVARGRRSGTNG